jgi:hypothetical protein
MSGELRLLSVLEAQKREPILALLLQKEFNALKKL